MLEQQVTVTKFPTLTNLLKAPEGRNSTASTFTMMPTGPTRTRMIRRVKSWQDNVRRMQLSNPLMNIEKESNYNFLSKKKVNFKGGQANRPVMAD